MQNDFIFGIGIEMTWKGEVRLNLISKNVLLANNQAYLKCLLQAMVYKLYHITYYTIVALFVKLGFILRRKSTELLFDSFIF